jgi:hypothetical protein
MNTQPTDPESVKYCNLMEEIKRRITVIDFFLSGTICFYSFDKVRREVRSPRLRAGISRLGCCASVFSLRDDWSDWPMIHFDQVLTASVPGNRRCGSGGTGSWW